MGEQVFLDRVLVQAGDGGQPPGDRGPCPAGGFQVTGEQLDVGAAGGEQGQVTAMAPGGELAQVQGAGLPGPEYPARNPANASFSASENAGSITARAADDDIVVVMGYLPRAGRDRKRSRRRMTTST